MAIKLGIALFCGLLFFGEACGSKTGDNQFTSSAAPESPAATQAQAPAATKTAAQPPPPAFDVCSLIDKAEIAAVQGGQVQSVAPTERAGGQLDIAQCYYTVVSADGKRNLSVHLQVIQAEPKSSTRDAVRNFWREKFERRVNEDDRERAKGDRDEEEEGGKPLPVKGLGDEALWVGDTRAGALYVLKKDKLVRVSVGGHADEQVRIEKSKTLAARALKRLP